MKDPYQVLGVSPNATDDEVKAAYRALARKYHPDNYVNNPLADLATEKMKEINEAYEAIQTMRKSGGGSSRGYQQPSSSYQGGYSQQRSANGQFMDIRRMIDAGRISEAEELLDGIPSHARSAEWFFLKGHISYKRGWLDQAMNQFSTACRMDPSNQEYANAYRQLAWQYQTGSPMGGGNYQGSATTGGCTCCDMCAMYACLDCLCGNGC